MKKISLFIIMLILAIGVKAQGHFIVPIVGLNGSGALFYGTSFMKDGVKYDFSQYPKMKLGLSAGVNYRYESKRRVVFETGFNYNQYGYAFKDLYNKSGKIIWNHSIRYQHFSVPAMVGYMFVVGRNQTFTLTPKLGIQLGYYTNMEQKYNYLDADNQENSFDEKKAVVNGVDIAQILDIEFGWTVNRIMDVFVSVTERYSFRNMFNVDDYNNGVFVVEQDIYAVRGDVFNYSLGVNVGLRINLSSKKIK